MPNLAECIKQNAINAIEAGKPVEICFGKVVSCSPFRVQLEQKIILEKKDLLVRYGITTKSFESGQKLILFRCQGGQQYLIFDRIGGL